MKNLIKNAFLVNTMMMAIIILITVLFKSTSVLGQNLVPNPSFEEYKELRCNLNIPAFPPFENPKTWFQSILYNWTTPTKIPAQVYSTLLGKNCLANPTHFNHGYPKDGFNITEVGLLGRYLSRANGRTYIEVKLVEKLTEGESYLAGGFYSLANNYGAYASNNLGMLFTTDEVSSDTTFMLKYNPQINEHEVNVDPLSWKPFGGCLTANGDEQYLTIGNFFDDDHTRSVQVLSGDTRGADFASYFIDSVFVERIKPISIPNVITPNGDGKNEKFVIEGMALGQWTLSIYNRWETEVYQNKYYKNEWEGGELSSGVYFYHIQHNVCSNLFYKGLLTIIH